MGKDPAVLFYYESFMVGTQFMSDEEVGKYIRLLCCQFDKGHLSKELVLTVCKANEIPMGIKTKLLIDDDGLYFNERADIEKEKRRKFISSRKHTPSLEERTDTASEALADHTININRNINKDKNKGTFIKPTIEEVTTYCKERKNKVNPQSFIDHYTSNGWRVGKNPMKDWKAAVRTWEKNNFDLGNGKEPTPQAQTSPYIICEKCGAEVLKSDFEEIKGKKYCVKCPEFRESAERGYQNIIRKISNE